MRSQSPFRIKTMDNKKTAEIWMEFDRAYRKKEESFFSCEQELQNILLWLERWTGVYREKEERAVSWQIRIRVRTRSGPIPAFIRIFPREGRLSDRVPSVRQLTDDRGNAVIRAGQGDYTVRVNHGPAYRVWESQIRLPRDAGMQLEALLEPLGEEEAGWLAGDLHHHSIYSSPAYGGTDAVVETAGQVSLSMKAAGCAFGALSDHHNILNHGEWGREKSNGFIPLISKEISTSNGHVAALGAKTEVSYDIPEGKNRTDERLKREFVKTAEAIRAADGLPQLNHPFDTSKATSWPRRFGDIVSIFSCVEIFNGAHPVLKDNGNGRAVDWWLSLLSTATRITGTAGSDTHQVQADQFDKDMLAICRILESISEKREQLPGMIRKQTDILEAMGKRSLPCFLDWAGGHLGSACVRTYVKVDGEASPDRILDAIRQGKCMVTDGPLLYVEADGAGPGEHRRESGSSFTVKARILTEEEPGTLKLYLGDGRVLEREVTKKDQKSPCEYAVTLSDIPSGAAAWLVCTLENGYGCRSAANPIYLS